MKSVPENLESLFGQVQRGWKVTDHAAHGIIQIAEYVSPGGSLLGTLGLHRVALQASSGRVVRQEWLLRVPAGVEVERGLHLLTHMVDVATKNHWALQRGEVVALNQEGERANGVGGVYTAIPVFLQEERRVIATPEGDVVLCWLLPVSAGAVADIQGFGWAAFEERLDGLHEGQLWGWPVL